MVRTRNGYGDHIIDNDPGAGLAPSRIRTLLKRADRLDDFCLCILTKADALRQPGHHEQAQRDHHRALELKPK
jgi:predicted RNA polymerase sigma factor